ncbi:iron uptake system component EfeO [Paenibacillus phyllosphaerae]|uniref:Iron uptake system component EfeO n=1 Tax=Paenibacillus phyllosphaerae TaxID=274593 RepID=A0A7W5FQW1_9BACL|nr:iron uptake system protein EfeO [Paenibacillus phyllosphaerae]MBB3113876.1 iron uptake system component EfeO [Paenibacillus phyllosphaerae]
MKVWNTGAVLFVAASIALAGCGNKENNQAESAEAGTTAANTANTTTESADAPVDLTDAMTGYKTYGIEQCDQFIIETEKFVTAVKNGDLETAKALYAPTRMYYERIEPIAESLGDFDPNIDARENDVPDADWRGFHKIEQSLWVNNTTDGMAEVADRLFSDVQALRALMETVEVDSTMLVTGAVELLNEVSSSKVTGEEERYSHTDLYDFVANVEGAKKIYELLQPALQAKDAELEAQIGENFTAMETLLAKYKSGDGYVSYTDLTEADTKALSQALDALAEPLSQMGTILEA